MKPPRYFTPTFKKFFIGFLCIIGFAFGVMVVTAQFAPAQPSYSVATP